MSGKSKPWSAAQARKRLLFFEEEIYNPLLARDPEPELVAALQVVQYELRILAIDAYASRSDEKALVGREKAAKVVGGLSERGVRI